MDTNLLTASRLRENIYTILDQVLETGTPVEILRNGRILRIVADANKPPSKLDRLPQRDLIVGDPDDLVHMDWSAHWMPDGAPMEPQIAARAMDRINEMGERESDPAEVRTAKQKKPKTMAAGAGR